MRRIQTTLKTYGSKRCKTEKEGTEATDTWMWHTFTDFQLNKSRADTAGVYEQTEPKIHLHNVIQSVNPLKG